MQFWHGSTDFNQNLSSTVSNALPTWTCRPALPIPNPLKLSLHNTSADIWTAPLCSVCYSCANWRWSPLSPPLLPVWQRLTRVPFFLEPCGRMRALTNRRHACLKWHETESVECVVKTCTCVLLYLKPRRYDKQSMNLGKFANCSEADTFTAHFQQTKDVFKMSFKFKIMFQGHDSACGQGFRSTRWIL